MTVIYGFMTAMLQLTVFSSIIFRVELTTGIALEPSSRCRSSTLVLIVICDYHSELMQQEMFTWDLPRDASGCAILHHQRGQHDGS